MTRLPNIMAAIERLPTIPRDKPQTSMFVRDAMAEAYLRYGIRSINPTGSYGPFITIAVFDVRQKGYCNLGLFKEAVLGAEFFVARRPDIMGVYVESLGARFLVPSMRRLGYHIRGDASGVGGGYGADWFKIINPSADLSISARGRTVAEAAVAAI